MADAGTAPGEALKDTSASFPKWLNARGEKNALEKEVCEPFRDTLEVGGRVECARIRHTCPPASNSELAVLDMSPLDPTRALQDQLGC